MIRVDCGCAVGLVCCPVCCTWREQGVVGVEHGPGQDLEPLSGDTSGVYTILVVETYTEFAVFDLLTIVTAEPVEGVCKDELPANTKVHRRPKLPASLVKLLSEIVALIVEIKHLGIVDEEAERAAHEGWICSDHCVEDLPVLFCKGEEILRHCLFWCPCGWFVFGDGGDGASSGRGRLQCGCCFWCGYIARDDHERFDEREKDHCGVAVVLHSTETVTELIP